MDNDTLHQASEGDNSDSRAAPIYPIMQVSRRFIQTVLMVWGLTSVLMLRSVPAFVMQVRILHV